MNEPTKQVVQSKDGINLDSEYGSSIGAKKWVMKRFQHGQQSIEKSNYESFLEVTETNSRGSLNGHQTQSTASVVVIPPGSQLRG